VCASAETTEAPFAWRGKVRWVADLGVFRHCVPDAHSSDPNLISFAGLSPALMLR